MQININEITNGYLVMTPPKPSTVRSFNQGQEVQQQPQPEVKYCAEVDDICIYLHQLMD